MAEKTTLSDADMFVMLDKSFRRRTRLCRKCAFSLPFRVFTGNGDESTWSVQPTEECSEQCRLVLDELISEFQARYRLSDSGHFYALGGGES